MVRQMSVRDVKARLDAGEPVLLLDVRQPEEYAICHLPGSVLVPLRELPERIPDLEIPFGATVVVYCHHGVRSVTGAVFLAQAGVENVASMAGGIDAWSAVIDPMVPIY
ncbi:MAG: rhodanese-like domain-containing protein [Fimbriiglobus sp.]